MWAVVAGMVIGGLCVLIGVVVGASIAQTSFAKSDGLLYPPNN